MNKPQKFAYFIEHSCRVQKVRTLEVKWMVNQVESEPNETAVFPRKKKKTQPNVPVAC